MASPPRRPAREITLVSSWSDFDSVTLVKAGLTQLESGMFQLGAQIVDAMGRDDRIEGCLGQRFQGLLGLPMTFEDPDSGDGRRKGAIAKKVEKLFPTMFPEHALNELLHWGHNLGVGLGELVWDLSGEVWVPTLKVWHPRFLRWNHELDALEVTTKDDVRVVTPGDGQWVVYAPYGLRRGWMRGFVRSLAVPWLIRQWAMRDWARYSEIYGIPARKAIVPKAATQEAKDEFVQAVATLANDIAIKLEQEGKETGDQNFDLEFAELAGTGWDGFEKAITRADTNIAVRILGQNLTTEVKGGSFAAATVHSFVKQDKIDFDAGTLTTCLRQQAIGPFCFYNFGSAELAPWPRWQTQPPDDKKSRADAQKTTGEAISALQATGAQPDVDRILEDAGIPVKGPAGDPPEQQPADDAGEGDDEQATRSAALAAKKSGYVAGQLFADELAADATTRGAKLLEPDLKALLDVVEASTSFEDMRKRLEEAYRGMSRAKLQAHVEKAVTLAELAGHWSALEDG